MECLICGGSRVASGLMAKLNDLEFAGLIDEIACAVRTGEPVEASLRRLQSRRLGRTGWVAGQIADRLESGQSLAEAIRVVTSPIVQQVSAAIDAAERGAIKVDGGQRLISRMSEHLRRRDQFMRTTRIAYFYPLLLAAIAYAATVLVAAPVVRQNQGRDFQWAPWLVSSLAWIEANAWWPPIVALLTLIVIWMLLRRRHALPRHSRLSLFFSSLADQVRANVPDDQAIANAARLSGDSELSEIENPSFDSPVIKRMIGKSTELSDIAIDDESSEQNAPKTLQVEPSILAARLYYLAGYHAERARRAAYVWSVLVPRAAMILVGCGFVLSYAWWVIAPVYRQVAQW